MLFANMPAAVPIRSASNLTAMTNPRKLWMASPAKRPKPSVPDTIKAALIARAEHFIETVLRPARVAPPKPGARAQACRGEL